MTPASVSAASLPRCSAAPTTTAFGKLLRSPGKMVVSTSRTMPAASHFVHSKRSDISEAHELREHAGDEPEQDAGPPLSTRPRPITNRATHRTPEWPGTCRGIRSTSFPRIAQRGDQRDQQQVAQGQRPDVGRLPRAPGLEVSRRRLKDIPYPLGVIEAGRAHLDRAAVGEVQLHALLDLRGRQDEPPFVAQPGSADDDLTVRGDPGVSQKRAQGWSRLDLAVDDHASLRQVVKRREVIGPQRLASLPDGDRVGGAGSPDGDPAPDAYLACSAHAATTTAPRSAAAVMTGQSRRRRERVCTTDHREAYFYPHVPRA